MTLKEKIARWKDTPNALGSEAQAGVIVGEVATALNEQVPNHVNEALRQLSLRGTMRDIAQAIGSHFEMDPNLNIPSFHRVVETGAASCGISWAEAIVVITQYLEARKDKVN